MVSKTCSSGPEIFYLVPNRPTNPKLWSFFLYGVIYYLVCGGVICMHGCWLLWVAHFLNGESDQFIWFGVVKNPPNYESDADESIFFMMLESVRSTSFDSLVLLKLWYTKKNAYCAASSVYLWQVWRIAVYAQCHVSGMVYQLGVWILGTVMN